MSNTEKPPGPGQAKTLFGYQAPVSPGRPPGAQQPPGAAPPPGAGQGAPPAQNMFGTPGAQVPGQPPGGMPPQQQWGQPPGAPMGAPGGMPPGAPPQPQWGQPPAAPMGAPGGMPQQQQWGQPPAAPQPAPQQWGQPAAPPPAAMPPQPQWGQPAAAPMGAPAAPPPAAMPPQQQWGQQPGASMQQPVQPQWGQPAGVPQQPVQPQWGQAPGASMQQPVQPQWGQPAGVPQQPVQPQWGQQQQFGHQAMANLANKLPTSQPGTLFGVPLATLRDPGIQHLMLLIGGVLLLASIIIPLRLDPTLFVWKSPEKFKTLIWPILAGAAYLLVGVAPENLRRNVPPVVLHWLPFGVSFASIIIVGRLFPFIPDSTGQWLANIGYPFLLFALLATMSKPQDQIARILIGVGAGLMAVPWITFVFDVGLKFSGVPALFIIHNLLQSVVFTLAVACAAFVIKPDQVPALAGVDAFKPLATAVLLAWLPVKAVLLFLVTLIHFDGGASSVFGLVHYIIPVIAYFGVLMVTAPAAYEELSNMFLGGGVGGGGGQPYQPPQQQWNQPPQQQWGQQPMPPQAGMPPQGGYPPPGGMPPQGGYPPPGGQGGWGQGG